MRSAALSGGQGTTQYTISGGGSSDGHIIAAYGGRVESKDGRWSSRVLADGSAQYVRGENWSFAIQGELWKSSHHTFDTVLLVVVVVISARYFMLAYIEDRQ